MRKKMIAVLMVCLLVVTGASATYALDAAEESLSRCLSCGDLSVESRAEYGEPKAVAQRFAENWYFGVDVLMETEYTVFGLCRSCGWEDKASYTDSVWEDRGFHIWREDGEEDYGCCEPAPASKEVEEELALRNIMCPYDDGGELIIISTHYGPWYNTGNQRYCEDRPYGVDLEEARAVTITRKCTRCNYGMASNISERNWICRGFY